MLVLKPAFDSSAVFWGGKTCLLRVVILNCLPLPGYACTQGGNFPSLVLKKKTLLHFIWYPVFCWVEKLPHLNGNLGLRIVEHLKSIIWPWVFLLMGQKSGDSHWFASDFTSRVLVSSLVGYPSLFSFFFFPIKFTKSHVWKFPYSFRSPGAAELIGESQLLMVQVSVEYCVFIWGLQPQGKKQTGSEWRRVIC